MPNPLAKKWPTVANRHRRQAIDKLQQIETDTDMLSERLSSLYQAINDSNILLANAILSDLRGRARLIGELAAGGRIILQTAPAEDDEDDNES